MFKATCKTSGNTFAVSYSREEAVAQCKAMGIPRNQYTVSKSKKAPVVYQNPCY